MPVTDDENIKCADHAGCWQTRHIDTISAFALRSQVILTMGSIY